MGSKTHESANLCEQNNDGFVSLADFEVVMPTIMAHPEILAILRAFGLTNQKMNFEEFQRFFENLCKREFQKSDLDVNGFLSQDEVTAMLARATSSLPEDLADAFTSKVFISMIFNEVDANKDGKISYEEYRYQ